MEGMSSDQSKEVAHTYRATQARTSIIAVLTEGNAPLSVGEILDVLKKRKSCPNKTTVYRQLATLIRRDMVKEVQFTEGAKRYEMADTGHHHHVVCTQCKRVEDVTVEGDLAAEEKMIAKTKKFKALRHSLEFYGLCPKCA